MSMHSTQRFSDRVSAYVAARPRYPVALAPLLARELRLPADAVVADIGCGTGLSSEPFLAAGFAVIGVEPDDAMRAAAERELAPSPRFRSVKGVAEATTLAPASIDLVVADQAYHWFDPVRFGAELRRILKPGGALALFWNARLHDASPFMADYDRAMTQFCPQYDTDFRDATRSRRLPFMRIAFGGDHYRKTDLDHTHPLDRTGLIARFESGSGSPQPGDLLHEPMVAGLNALFDRHARNAVVEMSYRTLVFFGHPRPPQS